MGNTLIVLYTGQQMRPNDYKDSTVKGQICINTNSGTPYLALVYDPIKKEPIWTESSTTTDISTILHYKVSDDNKVWEVLIILGDNIIYPLLSHVNIFQSIKGKHLPELCWQHLNLLAVNPELYTTRSNNGLTLNTIHQRFPNLNPDTMTYLEKINSNGVSVNDAPVAEK